jgi:hypothetical protein
MPLLVIAAATSGNRTAFSLSDKYRPDVLRRHLADCSRYRRVTAGSGEFRGWSSGGRSSLAGQPMFRQSHRLSREICPTGS